MSASPDRLSKEKIMAALHRLNELLHDKGVIGELCVFGGAAMVLAFDARDSTRDVDAIFAPKGEVAAAARQVTEEMDFDPDWLNDGVKGFVPSDGEVTSDGMPVFTNLRVMRPTTEYLLAMKCLASRVADYGTGGDKADVATLIKHLGITGAAEVADLVAGFYKESQIPPKVWYFIEEVMAELNANP